MTSWYHFSKSRAGSHTGPPSSCCSIWREMPRERGRARRSERDRHAREVGASLPVPSSPRTRRPPGTPGTPWPRPGSSGIPPLLVGPARADTSAGKAQRPPALHHGTGRARAGSEAAGRAVRGVRAGESPSCRSASSAAHPFPCIPVTSRGEQRGGGRETGHEPLQRRRKKRETEEEEEEEEQRSLRMKEPKGRSPAGKRQGHGGRPGCPRAAQRSRTGQREAD